MPTPTDRQPTAPTPALGYVSRGLGVMHVPLRIHCPAELTLATLTPA